MNFRYSENKSGKAEYLRVEGPDYRMQLTPVVGHDFTPELLAFYKGRAVPTQTSFYFSGRWKGEIVRIRDGQCLSPVCVEFVGDTVKVYAHAVFGKQYEVLYNEGYREGAFHYVNNNGEFVLYPSWQNGQIIFEGEGFYMALDPLTGDWNEALRFYKGYEVTRNVDGYLFGTYVGQGIGRMANMDLLYALFNLSPDMLDIRLNVTLRFLEGGRVVETIKSECVNTQMNVILGITGNARSQRDAKIYNYSVSDNQLIIKKDKFTILENGDLVWRGVNDGKFCVETIILHRVE